MMIYNVLWLDDYFIPIPKDNNDINENYRRAASGFLRDVHKVEESGIGVKGVPTYEEFAEEFKRNPNLYQGVVFDLRGMANSAGKEASDYVVADAIELVNQIKPVPMYVYSANTDLGKFEMTIRHIVESGRAFDKGELVRNLITKMLSDFDSSYHFYVGHEECHNLFNEGFLDSEQKAVMDEIVKGFSESSLFYDPYNRMRKVLENMLQKLNDIGIIKINADSKNSFNQRIRYLCESCYYLKDANGAIVKDRDGKPKPDFNNPYVSFDICNQETKYLIKFLGDMTNHNSHFITKHSDSYYGAYYNRNVLNATYCAFFAVMKWYYTYMHDRSIISD
ncbi:MAG: hypothetical protein K2J10_04125 [Muribaculaceae bacterium]|nr:hypothetical protein [Muribaculaceae bacterium]